jgi:hypothetical protein
MTTFPRTILFTAALMASGAAFAQAPAAPPAAAPAAPKAATEGAVKQTAPAVVMKDAGLAGTQSIKYDLYFDRYIASNDGAAAAGYITTITGDGKLDQLKFIAGGVNGADLTDPKGIYVRNGSLYVADAAKGVRVFDLITGKQTAKYDIPGAIALNGIAVTADNLIFVTDLGKTAADGAIYKIDAGGKVTKIVSGAKTERPSGVDINPNRLDKDGGSATIAYVTGDASDIVLIDQNGTEIQRTNLNIGKLSGISYTDDGFILVDTADGAVDVLDPYWKPTQVQTGITGAAGIGWDWVRNRVMVAEPAAGIAIMPGPNVPGFPGSG